MTPRHRPARSFRPSRRAVLAGVPAAALCAAVPARDAVAARTPTGRADVFGPQAAYWFPDSVPGGEPDPGVVWRSLLDYVPEDDPDLPYNTATVPLAERPPADGARVQSLVSFAPTSGNPSQGAPDARYYAFTDWALVEELVFWGGSSFEGLILAPNAPVVDAAHRNGVPVLGTVFLPPAAYGGDLRWTRELVQRDAMGGYPVADKLAEVATAYGFDGWFVNAETGGGDRALAEDMRGFLKRLRAAAPLRITWYDSMTADGGIDWRNRLDDANEPFFHDADGPVAHTMFLNFDWTARGLADSAERARGLGRDPYELWAGVDLEANGTGTRVDWDALFGADPDGKVSIGFYRPEWTHTRLPEDAGPEEFHRREERMWHTGEGDWPGVAAHVEARAAEIAPPFATAFNTGHGLRYAVEGSESSEGEWSHLGVQDVLPPRRWSTSGGTAQAGFDFAEPYHGGSCLKVSGIGAEPAEVGLYPLALPDAGAVTVELVYRGAGVDVEVAVGGRRFAARDAGDAGGGWRRVRARVPEGAEPGTLSVCLSAEEADGGAVWRLGLLRVTGAGAAPPPPPSGARVEDARPTGEGTAELRLRWNPVRGARHYELFHAAPEGAVLLGATATPAFHIRELRRRGGERYTRLEITAVGHDYGRSACAVLRHRW
ncbi:endo-beta-N-acetylglucosaminidase [Nocardiopsis suaedae]|uniref:Mannosyl-glycoprotein endo-beta-N-acetylglucosaminidase n=1 Tax=Nocardiopsis suaedae TaxID=3018444 RepID=A0ABT4TGL9_9ACTN|nr:hypothetical protein [Nocardiopsis suaedae]MDA2803842.1 hypothetical protein [Nocardiopsis suaedae]